MIVFARIRLRDGARTRVLLAHAFLLLLYSAGCAPPSGEPPRLQLVEIWSQRLPAGLELGGVFGESTDLFAIWDRLAPQLWVGQIGQGEGAPLRPIKLKSPALSVAIVTAEGSLEVLDTASSSLIQFAPLGEVERVFPVEFPHGVESALWRQGTWFLGVRNLDSSFAVHRVGNGGSEEILAVRSPAGPRRPTTELAVLSQHTEGLLVTLRFYPFTSYVLDMEGAILRQFVPQFLQDIPADSQRQFTGRLVSTPIMPLDGAQLQVLADPFSFARMLITLTNDGNTIRSSLLDAPMAFVASFPNKKVLIGYRRVDGPELLGYEWRWVPNHP